MNIYHNDGWLIHHSGASTSSQLVWTWEISKKWQYAKNDGYISATYNLQLLDFMGFFGQTHILQLMTPNHTDHT